MVEDLSVLECCDWLLALGQLACIADVARPPATIDPRLEELCRWSFPVMHSEILPSSPGTAPVSMGSWPWVVGIFDRMDLVPLSK